MTRRALLLVLSGVALMLSAAGSVAEMRLSLDDELLKLERGVEPHLHIAGARMRVAVFSYEDPDGSGLGDALAALMGREILLRAGVASIGVLRYEGRLSGSAEQPLSYFDKVEKVIAAQEVTLAVWGVIQRDGAQYVIDTYAQIPPATVQETFRWQVRLPATNGVRPALLAHVRPDRIRVQHLSLPLAAGADLQTAATHLDALRAAPQDGADIIEHLPRDAVYWVAQRDGDWTRFEFGDARGGWARAAGHCVEECAPLLEAARFAGGLLRFATQRSAPAVGDSLTAEARAIRDQLLALELLDREPRDTRGLIAHWWDEPGVPPGGAALANVRALAEVAIALVDRDYVPERLHAIAFELAGASQIDPRNTDVLHNLAVLFELAGDAARAQLARELAERIDPAGPQ